MTICTVYARLDGTIAHVRTDDFIVSAADAGTTRVARFDTATYPAIYNLINSQVKQVRFQNDALVLIMPDGNIAPIVDSAWIQAREAEIVAAETIVTDDTSERANLLALAANALTQIEND